MVRVDVCGEDCTCLPVSEWGFLSPVPGFEHLLIGFRESWRCNAMMGRCFISFDTILSPFSLPMDRSLIWSLRFVWISNRFIYEDDVMPRPFHENMKNAISTKRFVSSTLMPHMAIRLVRSPPISPRPPQYQPPPPPLPPYWAKWSRLVVSSLSIL